MLYLIHSNQLEELAQSCAALTRTHPLSPLERETIVVQNAGMGRWLSMQLAQHSGIAANLRYLFPAEATWELMRKVLPAVPERDPCSPKLLRWRLLDEFLQRSELYPELQHYLRDGDESAAWQLAQQVAGVFDGYLFFRPLWIRDWETAHIELDAADWQGRLWRNVVLKDHLHHWVRLQDEFMQALQTKNPENLPKRYIFFSIPAVSRAYINMVHQIAEFIDIYFFIVNPSQAYWSDIESERRKLKFDPEQQLLTDVGNPLLASWGTQGRDFIGNLRALEPYPLEREQFIFPEFGQATDSLMLKLIQADILELNHPEQLDAIQLDTATDYSIRVHSCHSPMREVQVLHDQILAALEADHTLAPSDIVVMVPDIDQYAPYIESVFGTVSQSKQRLPYSVADQSQRQLQSVINTCLQLLELPDSRFEAERIFALLEDEIVRLQARLDSNDVLQCREWVSATNIRWGVDAQRRQRQGGADTFEHTWRYGLDRLLLGFAFPEDQLWGDLLPYPHIEGSQAQILGRFLHWLEALFGLSDWSRQQHSISGWAEKIRDLFKHVFGDTDELTTVLQALEQLAQQAQTEALFERNVSWRIVRDALRSALEQRNMAEGFMGRGITFCALMPMRSVPFKFVALMGMQDNAFPRLDNHLSFDKMAHDKKQRGDRSRRDEDRYLFLESLLSARSRFYISYIGQSIHDNTEVMPCILVTELLDYIHKRFAIEPTHLVTHHPLQAFSTRYFSETNLFTYAEKYANAFNARNEAPKPFVEFWQTEPLPPLANDYKRVSLEQLITYFRQPAREFLQKRLNLKVRDKTIDLPEREPFNLDNYADRDIAERLLKHYLQSNTESDVLNKRLRAEGVLPHGKPGDLLYQTQVEQTEQFYKTITSDGKIEWLPTLAFDFNVGEFHLHGSINELTPNGRLVLISGKVNAWQWVDIWLKHIALNALPDAPTHKTLVHTPSQNFCLEPITTLEIDSLEFFAEGLHTYWRGLCEPLPCFPKSGLALFEKSKGEVNLKNAQAAWVGSEYSSSEAEKPENALLYRGLNPLEDERFTQWAERFWKPLVLLRKELN